MRRVQPPAVPRTSASVPLANPKLSSSSHASVGATSSANTIAASSITARAGGRPRLALKKRSAEASSVKRASIFGDAKPRDENAYMKRKAEEARQRKEAEAKKQAEEMAALAAAREKERQRQQDRDIGKVLLCL